MSQQQDPPIVISGGSVTIEFDSQIFTPSGNGKHSNANKKIRRVEITGDGVSVDETIPNGKVTIRIHYSNT